MRIAEVAPLFESVPPRRYGGTERIVACLSDALRARGHEVTLFASGDSAPEGLVAPCPEHLGSDATAAEALSWHALLLDEVLRQQHRFDVVHFHTGHLHLPLTRQLAVPSVTTLHGRVDDPGSGLLLSRFEGHPFVAISSAQRSARPDASWVSTILHGLPDDLYRWTSRSEGYLAFVGRAAPEKGLDRAIRIARRTAMPLRFAARVGAHERPWFDEVVAPLLGEDVSFVGELDDAGKQRLLAGADALLFPIDWPEPFGLVMIESLACGTPVVAMRHGAAPEVVMPGVSGFIVDEETAFPEAIEKARALDRSAVRAAFERSFTAGRMAEAYLRVFTQVAERRGQVRSTVGP